MLGHFISAIFSIPECKENLIFKGGTCLRKCYFSNYRFSEDLDFTCTNPKFELTKKMLNQLVQIITERTEIPLHIEKLNPLHHKMKFKGLEFTGIEQMINEDNDKRLKAAWKNSLGHQIPSAQLPDYEVIKKVLIGLLKEIFNS